MLSQSRSVNASIESCVTHLLRWKESQSQQEKNALCERAFNDQSRTTSTKWIKSLCLITLLVKERPFGKEMGRNEERDRRGSGIITALMIISLPAATNSLNNASIASTSITAVCSWRNLLNIHGDGCLCAVCETAVYLLIVLNSLTFLPEKI